MGGLRSTAGRHNTTDVRAAGCRCRRGGDAMPGGRERVWGQSRAVRLEMDGTDRDGNGAGSYGNKRADKMHAE